MSTKVAENAWGTILHHTSDKILELAWRPAQMTDAAFQATLALFVWQAESLRPAGLLIDATAFRHKFGAGIMEWRDACIVPRYGAAGVAKFALIMPPGFTKVMENGTEPAIDGPAVYPTAWFAARDTAIAWLRKG